MYNKDADEAVTLSNTIVAGNLKSASASDIDDTVTGSNNLIGTGGSGGLADGVGGKIVGVATADLGLGTLGPNGGPTQTMNLLPGSPAIDGGTSAGTPTTDHARREPPWQRRLTLQVFDRPTKAPLLPLA